MIVVLADADDARGFALAGARTVVCRTAADVAAAVRSIERPATAAPILVMVSQAVRALAPDEIDRLRDERGGPIVFVLPEAGGGA